MPETNLLSSLKVKIFADGADLDGIRRLAALPFIAGFTTNPTLMRKSGIDNYERFARDLLAVITDRPVSLEVFADDPAEMVRQGRKIAAWGRNVNVKIPVTDTQGRLTSEVIRELSAGGATVNVTAMMTAGQVEQVLGCIAPGAAAFVSVFAGRVADTGVDPEPVMREVMDMLAARREVRLIWASPREVLNIFQADRVGCDIITVAHDLLAKLNVLGRNLEQFSLETVRMFRDDALKTGFSI